MNHLTTYEHRVSRIRHWASCGENPTLAHFRHFSSLYTNEYRVSRYESFLQNKPNFPAHQMNATSVKTMNYEQITMNSPNKNKAKQTQPVVSLPAVSKVEPSNLFQTRRLLVNRAKPKFFNFACKNSLTGWRNLLKCLFSYGKRSYYEELYGKERTS
jgi:hypothetical protein